MGHFIIQHRVGLVRAVPSFDSPLRFLFVQKKGLRTTTNRLFPTAHSRSYEPIRVDKKYRLGDPCDAIHRLVFLHLWLSKPSGLATQPFVFLPYFEVCYSHLCSPFNLSN